jgi:hypothetical protein
MATRSPDATPPFVRVTLRFDRQEGRWHPCGATDRRGSLLTMVDGLGRPAIRQAGSPLGLGRSVGGFRLGYPTSSGPDPAEVVAFFAREAARRRKTRT